MGQQFQNQMNVFLRGWITHCIDMRRSLKREPENAGHDGSHSVSLILVEALNVVPSPPSAADKVAERPDEGAKTDNALIALRLVRKAAPDP